MGAIQESIQQHPQRQMRSMGQAAEIKLPDKMGHTAQSRATVRRHQVDDLALNHEPSHKDPTRAPNLDPADDVMDYHAIGVIMFLTSAKDKTRFTPITKTESFDHHRQNKHDHLRQARYLFTSGRVEPFTGTDDPMRNQKFANSGRKHCRDAKAVRQTDVYDRLRQKFEEFVVDCPAKCFATSVYLLMVMISNQQLPFLQLQTLLTLSKPEVWKAMIQWFADILSDGDIEAIDPRSGKVPTKAQLTELSPQDAVNYLRSITKYALTVTSWTGGDYFRAMSFINRVAITTIKQTPDWAVMIMKNQTGGGPLRKLGTKDGKPKWESCDYPWCYTAGRKKGKPRWKGWQSTEDAWARIRQFKDTLESTRYGIVLMSYSVVCLTETEYLENEKLHSLEE